MSIASSIAEVFRVALVDGWWRVIIDVEFDHGSPAEAHLAGLLQMLRVLAATECIGRAPVAETIASQRFTEGEAQRVRARLIEIVEGDLDAWPRAMLLSLYGRQSHRRAAIQAALERHMAAQDPGLGEG